ncbi:MerC domain-containing protein [Pseudomonadales bacterium]|nr:MerC domain-containing protein [Pseudomonadales bacterium]
MAAKIKLHKHQANEVIMKNIQAVAEKAAISLSFICAVHCLALPLMVVFLPSLVVFNLEDEASHFWMLAAVVPTSLFALTLGCKKHKKRALWQLAWLG